MERIKPPHRPPDSATEAGHHFVLKVPAGDPYLAKLIKVHGEDTIERDVRLHDKNA